MIRHLIPAIIAGTTLLANAAPAELRESARKTMDAHKDAIVWLSVLSKTSMSVDGEAPEQLKAALAGQEKEEKRETLGTLIDANGMIVTALGGMDQSSLVDGKTVNTPMGAIKLKASAEIKEIKVITADGSEIPADLVLKDEDLGLAFIKVRMESDEAKGVEFDAIDLTDSRKGELLEDCVSLGRADESLNRESSVQTSEITAITTRPRTFYQAGVGSTGTPVFLADGKLLGVSVVRNPKGGSASDGMMRLSPVVLPAADVAKVAAQARDAKPAAEAPKEEAADESGAE
jgi:hypothetical protein